MDSVIVRLNQCCFECIQLVILLYLSKSIIFIYIVDSKNKYIRFNKTLFVLVDLEMYDNIVKLFAIQSQAICRYRLKRGIMSIQPFLMPPV